MVKYLFLIIAIPTICFSEIKGYIESGKDLNYNIAYTELQIGYRFSFYDYNLLLYGNQKTWLEYRDTSGYPFNDIYTIGSELKFDNLTIDLSHFCSHRVVSKNSEFVKNYQPPQDGNLTKISIRLDF